MNILFISSASMPDYQCDSLFHGLRKMFGKCVVDVNKLNYLYKTFPQADREKLYGKGFTLYGLFDDDSTTDRNDIESKIKHQFFDLIIYGSIQREQLYIDLVLDLYPSNKIIFIDGEDKPIILNYLLHRGFYFKRELYQENRFILPIHFSIPLEKFVKDIYELEKKQFFAPCNPTDRTTYIYQTEEDYYQQYQESFFGITIKKGGWDCLRHYEIISQGCTPYFYEIRDCPYLTMHRFPRFEVLKLMKIADRYLQTEYLDLDNYLSNLEHMFNYAQKYLTTEAVAKYVIEQVKTNS